MATATNAPPPPPDPEESEAPENSGELTDPLDVLLHEVRQHLKDVGYERPNERPRREAS
ncbi:hypothetical protein [Streptomyces sp. NRRL F-2890]|uniref:hypothetical protein n=1 Tax=Streptomyces sp. NRRL F-2890 TaxID=1463845 RepID=UPI00131A4DE2|nr:hypothetical protein [Streptomyces sp. NRRL F-2890]